MTSDRPDWDSQFAETEGERNARLRRRRLDNQERNRIAAEADRLGLLETAQAWRDSRDPDHSRSGIFVLHNCWKCGDGARPCVAGNPRQCEYPHARND